MLPQVAKTAVLTLRARADEHGREDRVFADPLAAEWFSRLEWPAELDGWYDRRAQYNLAFRADDIDHLIRRHAAQTASLNVVELGCGLSTRRQRLQDVPVERWVDVDLPEIIALRQQWGAHPDEALGLSVLDPTWMDAIEPGPNTLFIAEGLLYYLPRPEVDALLLELRRRFSGAALTMDVLGANDYPTLRANTEKVGCPVQWHFEGDYSTCDAHFGLRAQEDFEPDVILNDALTRYWDRFEPGMRMSIYWAMHNETFWAGRSGDILARLTPLDAAADG